MPRNETIITTFVASPSDVREERAALELVINELNKTWSKSLGLRLDLIKWETDVHPDFGSYSQDVINTQINDEYDIFVAIFWGRIGSPTNEYDSGTLEEFDRAYKKYLKDNKSVNIMIYFKDQPIPPSKMDLTQLTKIQKLKNTLGEKGGLYWTFDKTGDFESLLRTHLSKVAQEWSRKLTNKLIPINSDEKSDAECNFSCDSDEDSDYGLLDYLGIYEDRMFDMTSSLTSIAHATDKIGQQFNRRTEEMKELREDGRDVDQRKARKVIKMSSDDMERFSEIIEPQTKILSKSSDGAFEALSKALAMYVDFNVDEDSLEDLEVNLIAMKDSASEGIEGLRAFRSSISDLPKLTIQLNKSKRRAVKLLDALLEEITLIVQTLSDVSKAIESLRNAEKI